MKIKDTHLGQQALQIANQIEAQQTQTPTTQAPSTSSPAAGQRAAAEFDGVKPASTQSLAEQLKAKLDEIRGLLGSKAVDELRADLPQAALHALTALSPDLPIAPGESPFVAFRKANADLLKLERNMQQTWSAIARKEPFWYSDGSGLEDAGSGLHALQNGQRPQPKYSYQSSDELARRGTEAGKQHNDAIRALWPEAPAKYLVAVPGDPSSGTLRVDKMRYPDVKLEALRAERPEYVKKQKDVVALKAHLEKTALPSDSDVIALKAQMFDPKISTAQLYREATGLIGEIEGFADQSKLKREQLKSQASGVSHTAGITGSIVDASGLGVATGFMDATTVSNAKGTSEVLNVSARDYTVKQTPGFNEMPWKSIDGINHRSPLEVTLMIDKLLTVRRMYEAMVAREPDSAHVGALKGWMEESTFHIQTAGYKGEFGDAIALKMADIRSDVLQASQQGFYPSSRLELIKDEIGLGPARTQGALSSLKRLSDV